MSSRDLFISSLPGLELQKCATSHSFCLDVGELDSHLHACVANTLPAEPSYQCTGLFQSTKSSLADPLITGILFPVLQHNMLFPCFFKNGVGGRAQCCDQHSFGADMTGVMRDEGRALRSLYRKAGIGCVKHSNGDPSKPRNTV